MRQEASETVKQRGTGGCTGPGDDGSDPLGDDVPYGISKPLAPSALRRLGISRTREHFAGLFAFKSEHRIVLSQLVFLADGRLLNGRHVAEFVVNALMLLLLGAAYWAAVKLGLRSTPTQALLAAAIVLCFAVSPLTFGVLVWAMHVQNVGITSAHCSPFSVWPGAHGRSREWTCLLRLARRFNLPPSLRESCFRPQHSGFDFADSAGSPDGNAAPCGSRARRGCCCVHLVLSTWQFGSG
jgi:hypothetical protein